MHPHPIRLIHPSSHPIHPSSHSPTHSSNLFSHSPDCPLIHSHTRLSSHSSSYPFIHLSSVCLSSTLTGPYFVPDLGKELIGTLPSGRIVRLCLFAWRVSRCKVTRIGRGVPFGAYQDTPNQIWGPATWSKEPGSNPHWGQGSIRQPGPLNGACRGCQPRPYYRAEGSPQRVGSWPGNTQCV